MRLLLISQNAHFDAVHCMALGHSCTGLDLADSPFCKLGPKNAMLQQLGSC